VAVLCAKVILVPLVFDQGADVPFTVPKALVSHGLAYILAGVLVGLFIRFGRSFVPLSWLHVPTLVFLGVSGIAALVASDFGLALYGTHVRMLGLGTIADWVVLYFAVALLIRTRDEAVAVAVSALGASALVLAYELVQLLGRDPFSWTVDVTLRPFSTIGQPTSLAQYLTVLAVGTATFALLGERLRRPARAALLVYVALLLAGAGATATRSSIVGLSLASAVLVVLVWMLHPSPRARWLASVTGVVALAALLGLLLLTPLGARVASTIVVPAGDDATDESLVGFEPSADARSDLYSIALKMIRERPLLGFGPDNFVVGIPEYRTESEPYEIRQSLATSAHGWPAQVATSSGVSGLLSLLTIIGAALVLVFRGGFRPFAIVGAVVVAAFVGTGLTTVDDLGAGWLLWLGAGLIAAAGNIATPAPVARAAARTTRSSKGHRIEGAHDLRRWAAIASAAIGVVIAVSSVNAFDASRSIRAAADARLVGQSADAIALGLRATRADPGRAEYWHGLGLAYLAGSRLPQAAEAFDRASTRAPYDARYIGDLARALLLLDQAGDKNARVRALELADRVVQIDRNNPRANLTRAVVMQVTGNLVEAATSIDRALALDPESRNSALYVTATQVYTASGRIPDAIRVAKEGISWLSPPLASVGLRIELARAYLAAGQPQEALAQLDGALLIQPNNKSAEQLRTEIRGRLTR
jgi:tetratricopeptide (TPR) repeat protein/O-antigen ligase